jgi:hypothetical protein
VLLGFAAGFRAALEYRFELAGILLSWLVLTCTSVLLAPAFRRGSGLSGMGAGGSR